MRFVPLLLLLALAGCRFEESRPAPVADPDAWGKLDADGVPVQPDPPPADASGSGRA
ncbi:MAG: hypothetical protein ACOYO0_00815 [Sandarakinorhabdus sp.]|jgi:hypothetical protein